MFKKNRADLEKQIIESNRRLQVLKQQHARQGVNTDPGVILEIEDIEAKLKTLQTELDHLQEVKDESHLYPPHQGKWYNKPLFWVPGIIIAVGLFSFLAWTIFQPQPEIAESSSLCSVEKKFVSNLVEQESQFQSLFQYYREINASLFEHLDTVAQTYRQGEKHRGVTYIMGVPGVGKSFVARNIIDIFPQEHSCTLQLGELFRNEAEKLPISVVDKPDLATLDGTEVFNELPSFTDPEKFDENKFNELLLEAECQNGELASLIIIDDLDEIHPDSAEVILKAVEQFISDEKTPERFIHIIVAGRPEGFAPWLKSSKRVRLDEMRQFTLRGPIYATTGDLEYLVRNSYDFLMNSVPTQADIDSFITLLHDYPFLTYSIRNLAMANFVIQQSTLLSGQSEEELKVQLFDNLLERNAQSHGRPSGSNIGIYGPILEEIAVRYLDQVNDEGFFAVRFEDTVEVVDEQGNVIGEARVRNVLDRSGLAFLNPANFTTTTYRFDPFWVHIHLVERRNQRIDPNYQYRTCQDYNS